MYFGFSAPYPYFLGDIKFCFHLIPILWLLPSKIGSMKKIKTFQKDWRQCRVSSVKEKEILCEIKWFIFIQESWTGEGFALCTVCENDFSVAHGGEKNINRHLKIQICRCCITAKKFNWFWSKPSDSKRWPKSSESRNAFLWFSH